MQELKNRVNIVDILSRSLHITKKGKNYWANCPFHMEKTPSFCISEIDQFYHCFGCGRSGDVITYLRETLNLEYTEAVEELCRIAGIEPPKKQLSAASAAYKKDLESIYNINKVAARHYRDNLLSAQGQQVRDYLKARGIDSNTIAHFGIGYSVSYLDLLNHLHKSGYSYDTMKLAGLIGEGQSGYYDALGERLIVPIINEKGEVIAFGGRLLQGGSAAKYKNTEQTKAFDKRRNLFGINIFKKLKRESNVPYAILVEGYMDVISLYQQGIQNSVASMGTALTSEQCALLKRLTNTVIVSFDSDSAGQSATMRSLDLLSDTGLEVKIVSLPEGLDPDDTIKRVGKNGFLALIDKALPLIDYKLFKIEQLYDLNVLNNRSKYANACIDFLATLKDAVAANVYLEQVAQKSGVRKEALADSLKAKRTEPYKKRTYTAQEYKAQQASIARNIEQAEDIVLSALLNRQEFAKLEDIGSLELSREDRAAIYRYMTQNINYKIGDFFAEDNQAEIGKLASIILEYGEKYADKVYADALLKLQRRHLEKQIEKLKEQYISCSDTQEKKDIIREINQLNLLQFGKKGE